MSLMDNFSSSAQSWATNVANGFNDWSNSVQDGSIFQNMQNGFNDFAGQIKDWFTNQKDQAQTAIEHFTGIDSGSAKEFDFDNENPVDNFLEAYQQTGDDAWLEKYLDDLLSQYNTQSARDYETQMSNTAFSRLVEDIKSAGYNPWMALQSGMNSASTPSVAASGTSGVSQSSQKTQKLLNTQDNIISIIRLLASVVMGVTGLGAQAAKAVGTAG